MRRWWPGAVARRPRRARGAAFAQDTTEQSAEHPHVGAQALRQFVLGLIAADEVDRFGSGEFAHETTVMARCFTFVTG
jgi:hypothetical protein